MHCGAPKIVESEIKIVFGRNKEVLIPSKQFYYSTGNNFLSKNTLKKGYFKKMLLILFAIYIMMVV